MARRRKKEDRPQPFFFLAGIEFCERFNFCILRGILTLYISEMLMYDERETKIIYHTFVAALYIFPLFGTILADSWLGKYRNILLSSLVCVVGNVLLTASATKSLQLPEKELGMVALILIAIGTGGIKSCLVAFGKHQFELPKHDHSMDAHFQFFYFIINTGSFIALLIAPLLCRHVSCLGQETCYPLAFFVPPVMMLLAIGFFRAGKPLYKKKRPEGSMLVRLIACICRAILNKLWKMRKVQKDHWLDYAVEEYGEEMVNDTKTVLPMFRAFLPLPIFWALLEQQATAWTFQARQLDRHFEDITILPDQMQIVNPALVIIFLPIFQYIIYPALRCVKTVRKPLQRVGAGGILAAIAFVLAALLQYEIENFDTKLPRPKETMMHVYNLMYCNAWLWNSFYSSEDGYFGFRVDAMTMIKRHIVNYPYANWTASTFAVCCVGFCYKNVKLWWYDGGIPDRSINNHFICTVTETDTRYYCDYLTFKKGPVGAARIRLVRVNFKALAMGPVVFSLYDRSGHLYLEYLSSKSDNSSDFSFRDIAAGKYGLEFGCSMRYSVTFATGGIYMVAICREREDLYRIRNFEMFPPKSLTVFDLLPQYAVMALAEVMFTISGLKFVHEEAPESMESLMQTVWLFFIGVGQLVVVAFEAIDFYKEDENTYLLYAGVTGAAMVFFILYSVCDYKYKNAGSKTCDVYRFTLIN